MNFRDAVVHDAMGGFIPLRWRRRVGKYQARCRAVARKDLQWHKGNARKHERDIWASDHPDIIGYGCVVATTFDELVLRASATVPAHGLYTLAGG
jgi:hypothetical protein